MILSAYDIFIFIAGCGIQNEWSKYKSKNGGKKMFQIDLALALMEHGIKTD